MPSSLAPPWRPRDRRARALWAACARRSRCGTVSTSAFRSSSSPRPPRAASAECSSATSTVRSPRA
eukprot:scaffold126767_cov69-Phaeocystis_antarctica.AAC.2